MSPELELLSSLVSAHARVLPDSHHRESITVFRRWGRAELQHHGFGDTEPPPADDAALEELHSQGLISIEYHQNNWSVTPTKLGRHIAEELGRAHDEQPKADLTVLAEALEHQARAENKLAWASVRPVLAALRRYWEEAGFPAEGIGTMPLLTSVPDGTEAQFQATIRSLIASGFLGAATDIELQDIPAFVAVTERTHAVLDGWPGATSQELVENLLAVLAERAATEPDGEQRRRLERVRDTVRELGVSTASEVLAKVLTGG